MSKGVSKKELFGQRKRLFSVIAHTVIQRFEDIIRKLSIHQIDKCSLIVNHRDSRALSKGKIVWEDPGAVTERAARAGIEPARNAAVVKRSDHRQRLRPH